MIKADKIDELLKLLETETGVSVNEIPYYDSEIYYLLSAGNYSQFLPDEFFLVYNVETFSFSQLCRAVGIFEYYGYLSEQSARLIDKEYEYFYIVPYCKEELEESKVLYSKRYDKSKFKNFNKLFDEICCLEDKFLTRDEIRKKAKSIAALQWFILHYELSFVKCRLKMLSSGNSISGRDDSLFCCFDKEKSWLNHSLWFDKLGEERKCDPYFLYGDELETAEKISLNDAVFISDEFKRVVMNHWTHKITDRTLLNSLMESIRLNRENLTEIYAVKDAKI